MYFNAQKNNKGFTIIELLIAMAGFSFVLLLVTVVMINIGNLSSKGINQTKIDDAARYISDDVVSKLKLNQASQFSSSSNTFKGVYCVANVMYSYSYDTAGANYLRQMPKTGSCTTPVLPNGGINMLPANTKLTYFNVSQYGNQFVVKVSLLYGSFTAANIPSGDPFNTKCKIDTSYTYCNVTSLETVVSSRVN